MACSSEEPVSIRSRSQKSSAQLEIILLFLRRSYLQDLSPAIRTDSRAPVHGYPHSESSPAKWTHRQTCCVCDPPTGTPRAACESKIPPAGSSVLPLSAGSRRARPVIG